MVNIVTLMTKTEKDVIFRQNFGRIKANTGTIYQKQKNGSMGNSEQNPIIRAFAMRRLYKKI